MHRRYSACIAAGQFAPPQNHYVVSLAASDRDTALAARSPDGGLAPSLYYRELADLIGGIDPDLIILDALVDFFLDENSTEIANYTMRLLRALTRRGDKAKRSIIAVHHANKTAIFARATDQQGAARGAYAIEAKARWVAALVREQTDPARARLTIVKRNCHIPIDTIPLAWVGGVLIAAGVQVVVDPPPPADDSGGARALAHVPEHVRAIAEAFGARIIDDPSTL
jgi:hypothetical protein